MDAQEFDPNVCYEAVQSRDARFDGRFFVAVLTTGVYCRVSCRSRTPRRENVRFFPNGAAARSAGFRPCRRCHPELLDPGAPPTAAVVPEAMGEVATARQEPGDPVGVEGLARRLGWSPRHLQRLLASEAGLSPHDLLGFLRLHYAHRALRHQSSLTRVADDAGYPSLRALQGAVRRVYGISPGALRSRLQAGGDAGRFGPPLALELPYAGPFAARELIRFLAVRAVPGLEAGDPEGGWYRRALRLEHGLGRFTITVPAALPTHVLPVMVEVEAVSDLPALVLVLRNLCDLDADTSAIARTLARDPRLAAAVQAAPGLRVPGEVDGVEMAVRAVLGQQISVEAARTHTARLVDLYGTRISGADDSVRVLFPTAQALAHAGPDLPGMALPASRKRTLHGLAQALCDGTLPPLRRGADPDRVGTALERLYGVGPWTRAYIAMRALGDPDAFLAGDLAVRQGYRLLYGREASTRELEQLSESWRPFRAYATLHLWHALGPKTGAGRPSLTPKPTREVSLS